MEQAIIHRAGKVYKVLQCVLCSNKEARVVDPEEVYCICTRCWERLMEKEG